MPTVFINPGHGAHDSGAVNHNYALYERDLAKLLGIAISQQLNSMQVNTRVYQEINSLNEVPQKANASNADIFVSIHMNAANTEAQGVETLYHSGSSRGKRLASFIQSELSNPIQGYQFTNRGIKERDELLVLKTTSMPACLVELGFIDNDAEGLFVRDHIEQCAKAVTNGIVKYLRETGLLLVDDIGEISNVSIHPTRQGKYNLYCGDTLILKENRLETINNYIQDNYIN